MSKYTVLESTGKDGQDLKVVFHVDVPDELNYADVNYRTALKDKLEKEALNVEGGDGTITSELYDDKDIELASIQSGSVYEVVRNVRVHVLWSDAEKEAFLNRVFIDIEKEILDGVKEDLKFWTLSKEGAK